MSQYDPDAPEGAKPRGDSYVSRKDIKWIVLIVVVLGIVFYPVYDLMRKDSEKKQCGSNIQQIAKAITQYAALNDDRFPPLYDEVEPGLPRLVDGHPYIWASLVGTYMSSRAGFGCPAATPEEHCRFHSNESKQPVMLAYGMFLAAAARPDYQIPAKETLVLLAETNNHGAGSSYNPVPFQYEDGSILKDDGFVVGFDNKPNGNYDTSVATRFVTRLAFRNTSGGDFSNSKVVPRHSNGIHVIYADGHQGYLTPGEAMVTMQGERSIGAWRLD